MKESGRLPRLLRLPDLLFLVYQNYPTVWTLFLLLTVQILLRLREDISFLWLDNYRNIKIIQWASIQWITSQNDMLTWHVAFFFGVKRISLAPDTVSMDCDGELCADSIFKDIDSLLRSPKWCRTHEALTRCTHWFRNTWNRAWDITELIKGTTCYLQGWLKYTHQS